MGKEKDKSGASNIRGDETTKVLRLRFFIAVQGLSGEPRRDLEPRGGENVREKNRGGKGIIKSG